jgi:hypothetical protein
VVVGFVVYGWRGWWDKGGGDEEGNAGEGGWRREVERVGGWFGRGWLEEGKKYAT